jgi:acyl carrier protein phosphodiesterase
LNYLTHLFFSGPGEEALLGSLLGDFVKGNPAGRFPPAVADAILVHRKIDSFSDNHLITRRSRNRISPLRRRFAGIIVDVCYDHFLSRHWQQFSTIDMQSFVGRVYFVLSNHREMLPERLRRVLPRMIAENWLGNYTQLRGVGDALDRIAGRLSRGGDFKGAVAEIDANYRDLEADFLEFFPDLSAFCEDWKQRRQPDIGNWPIGRQAGEISRQ